MMKLHNTLSYLFLLVSCVGESLGKKRNTTINCAEGYYLKPHPYNCRDYYLCTSYGPKKMSCPIGKAFDIIRYTCLDEEAAICKIEHDAVISEDKETSAITPLKDLITSYHPENEITTATSPAPILSSTTTVKNIKSSFMPAREMTETSIPSINVTTGYITSPESETLISKKLTTIKSQPTTAEIFKNITSYSTNTTYTPIKLQSDITTVENFTPSNNHSSSIDYNLTVTESYPSQEDKITYTYQPTKGTNYNSTENQSQATSYTNFTSPSPSYHTIDTTIYNPTISESDTSIAKNVTFPNQPISDKNYTSTVHQPYSIIDENITSPFYHSTNTITYISTPVDNPPSTSEKIISPYQPTNTSSYTYVEYPINAENLTSQTYTPSISKSYSFIAQNITPSDQPTNATNYTSTVIESDTTTTEIKSSQSLPTPNTTPLTSTTDELHPSITKNISYPDQQRETPKYPFTVIEPYPTTGQNTTLPSSYHKTDTTAYIPIKTETNLHHSENTTTVIQSNSTVVENFRNNTNIYTSSTKPIELSTNLNNLEHKKFSDPINETVAYPISSTFQSFTNTAQKFPSTSHLINKIINSSKPYSYTADNHLTTSNHPRANKSTVSPYLTTISNFSSSVHHLNNHTTEQSLPITSQYITSYPYQSTNVTKIYTPSSTNNTDKTSIKLIQTQDNSNVTIPSILPFSSNNFINSTLAAISHYKLVFVKLAELLFVE